MAVQGVALRVPSSRWDLGVLVHVGSVCSACEGPRAGDTASSAGPSSPQLPLPGGGEEKSGKKPKKTNIKKSKHVALHHCPGFPLRAALNSSCSRYR